MQNPRIAVLVGDAGTAEYLLPILPQLQSSYLVDLHADPAGAGIGKLEQAGFSPIHWNGRGLDFVGTSLVICGTAGKKQALWVAGTEAAKAAGIRCLWLGDFFGSGSEKIMREKGLDPDVVAVIDDSTKAAFLRHRPQFPPDAVRVVGNPSFDLLKTLDVAEERREARECIGIHMDDRLVSYVASSIPQSKPRETLDVLIPWLKAGKYVFTMRFHPGDKQELREPLLLRLREELGHSFRDVSELKSLEYLMNADLVLTDYSTEGVKSTILGIPTAFIMLDAAQAYQRSRGLEHPFLPILDDRSDVPPAISVFNTGEIGRLDTAFDAEENGWRRASLKRFFSSLNDGKAGERVIALVNELCPPR